MFVLRLSGVCLFVTQKKGVRFLGVDDNETVKNSMNMRSSFSFFVGTMYLVPCGCGTG